MLKMTPTELFKKLQDLPEDKLREVVKMTKDWRVDVLGDFRKYGGAESLEIAAIHVRDILEGR